MLFFMDLNGDVKRIDSARIFQGSNDANKIQLITPITPRNTSIQISFTLPSGLVTTYYPLAVVGRYSLAALTDSAFVSARNNIQVYLWEIEMLENVTADNGTVSATFQITKPANIYTVASVSDLPQVGQSGVFYVVVSTNGNTYYKWNAQNGTYATQGTIAYADEQVTKPIGRTAENTLTSAQTDSVRTATDVQVVGETAIVYSQTSLSSSIALDYFPDTATIVVGAETVDGEELSATFEYYESTNAVLVSVEDGTPHSFTVSYSLQEQTVTSPVYFKQADCTELTGVYEETEDDLSLVGGVYVQQNTSKCPFSVEYAPLPSIPTGGISEDEITQILSLMYQYQDIYAAQIVDNTADIAEINRKIEDGSIIGLGEPTASATGLPAGASPTASATIDPDSPQTAKVINFHFGIPKGDKGDTGLTALSYSKEMAVTNATLPAYNTQNTFFNGDFNRTPLVNDTFFVPIHNTQSGRDYLGYYRVYSVGACNCTAVCFLITQTSEPQPTKPYRGTIEASDWEQVGAKFFYTIDHNAHGLANPIVLEFLVETEDGLSNSFFSYTVKANRDVKFTSDIAVTANYTILGE